MGTPGGSFINGRVFDTLNQQIQFHNFDVKVSYGGPIGGTIETSFGDDASVINSYPKNTYAPGTDIDITQAFLTFNAGAFGLNVGKYVTLAGAEVIDSPNDYNFSRSILFGYAIPFTHTGARLTWAMNNQFSLIAGVNRGWDTTRQHNPNGIPGYPDTSALTFEGGAAWNPSRAFSATLQGYSGQVEEGNAVAVGSPFVVTPGRPNRSVIDTVLTWHATPAWTFAVNGDSGQQTNSNIFDKNGNLIGYGTGTWSGVAGYANYAINSQWSATARAEYFADYGGLRTGQTMRWAETTATLQYAPVGNVLLRGEVRGDKANTLFFAGRNGNKYFTNAQFGLEAIVKWP